MLKRSRIVGSICILMALFLLYGCGSSSKGSGGEGSTATGGQAAASDDATDLGSVTTFSSPPSETTLLAGTAKAGTATCASCHSTTGSVINAFNKPASSKIRKAATETDAGWINGPHGNSNNIPALSGLEDSCKKCHDAMGDGSSVESSGNTALGTTNRPIVSCEACHGGGSNHRAAGGSVAPPVANPNALRCGRCHSAALPSSHITSNPEAANVFDNYVATKHAVSINSRNFVDGSTTDVRATCARCHSDEGAKSYIGTVNGTASYSEIKTALDTKDPVKNASVVQCRTCHDEHNPNRLLSQKATGLPSGWSNEFGTCTACHQLLKSDGTLQTQAYHAPFDSAGAVVNSHGDVVEIITDTHFDDSTTDNIEGYVVNTAGDHEWCNGTEVSSSGANKCGTCRDCHSPHKADLTINKQWAKSSHGGFLLNVKEAAVAADGKTLYSAASTETEAPAWIHYDFKITSRQSCQKCHTATGFRNYANSPTAYNPANNVFVAATGVQREMLYCWACHTDNTGSLRNPGAVTASYTDESLTYTFPDVAGSNVCMVCHSGRENGDSIKKKTGFNNLSFSNSHYLPAGGSVFTVIGYEFTGKDYSNPASYLHDKVGSSAAPGTGLNGPCVGCHMTTSESHLFMPVKNDETTGTIKTVTSSACVTCHGSSITAASLEEEKEMFEASLAVLNAQLAAKGYFWGNSSPYFFKDTNANGVLDSSEIASANAVKDWRSTGDTDNTGNTTGKNNMGAAHNYQFMAHDPGGFAHNRYYAKRLIYDSLDWLDNNILDGSVSTAISNLTVPTADQKAKALAYLDNGTRP